MVIAGLTPREAVRAVEARLSAAGCPDADYDARELFRVAAGRDARLSDRVLTTEEAEKLEALCTRREQREPLQYLCGIWSFLDFDLAVGPGVLCPRADTEVVAEAAANTLTGIAAPRVLDLCAGTGCLGLGVKRFCPAAQVTCVEKSPEAFVYLEKNCRCALKGQGGQTEDLLEPTAFEQTDAPAFDWGPALNALRAKAKPAYAVQPVEGDLFTYWQGLPEGQLDLIVSNPPYLTAEEMGICSRRWRRNRPWRWKQERTALCFTVPLQSITRMHCGPAERWCWRSAGSSGRLWRHCWLQTAGQTLNAARILAATTGA